MRQTWVSNKAWSQKQTKHNKKRCRGERVEGTREEPGEIPAAVLPGARHRHTHALGHDGFCRGKVSDVDTRCPNFQTQW